MSFNANFYVAKKKENSTEIPTSPLYSYPIVLTENCSVMNPRIIVRMDTSPKALNYCYIAEFSRYYFINNWVWSEGRWIAEMTCDVLATYKSQIAGSSLYFLRASTAYDGDIPDRLYPMKKEPTIYQIDNNEQWFFDSEESFSFLDGYWVVGIVSTNGTTVYYAMDKTTFRAFSEKVFGTIDWANLNTQEISDSLTKALFNPFQYITSCMWFPSVGSKEGWFIPAKIKFGWWEISTETGFAPYEIPPEAYFNKTFQLGYQQHPQASTRGDYLNTAPYRHCLLNIPQFGMIELDTNLMKKDFTLYTATIRTDLITGIAVLRVYGAVSSDSKKYVIHQATTQFGVPVQISDLDNNVSLGGILGTVGNVAKNIATGNFLGSVVGIGNAIEDVIPGVGGYKGANGSYVGISFFPQCTTICYSIADEDNADNGRPYCKNGTCASLGSGFYIAENGSINLTGATKAEIESVKEYLEGGFYYA